MESVCLFLGINKAMQDFSAVSIFLAVIEEKSFSKAAEKLGVTTSAVSKRVSALEAKLKVRLITRTTRRLELTEAGERYLDSARQALKTLQEAENAATENLEKPNGKLRISASVTFGCEILAKLMPLFTQKYPHIHVEVEMDDVFSKVNIENYDVIITSASIANPSYKATKLLSRTGAVCASPDFIRLHGKPDKPEDLLNFNCLLYSFNQVADEWVFLKNNQEIKVKVSGNMQFNNPRAVRTLTLEGLGISCLSENMVQKFINKGRLIPLLDNYEVPSRVLRAIYPDRRFVPVKVQVFIDFLIERLKDEELLNKIF